MRLSITGITRHQAPKRQQPAQSPPALAPSHLGLLARTTASNLSCRYLFALSGVPGSLTITCFFFWSLQNRTVSDNFSPSSHRSSMVNISQQQQQHQQQLQQQLQQHQLPKIDPLALFMPQKNSTQRGS